MSKYLWPIATLTVVLLAGVALLLWPFALGMAHGPWSKAVYSDVWSGVGVVVIALLGLGSWLMALRQEMRKRGLIQAIETKSASRPKAVSQSSPAPGAVSDSGADLDSLLKPLAESVLRDLTRQLQNKEERRREGV
ncbi:MAG: hypothetical protein M1318_00230 [Firmicutes bacterium]|jgi:hypothetical protein|nr:hypothetical protein [Bacillota bacterium]